MLQNRNPPIENAITLGAPLPTLACPSCPQYFHSKSGCSRHIAAKHNVGGFTPQESNSSSMPSMSCSSAPVSSESPPRDSFLEWPSSPASSDSTMQPPSSHGSYTEVTIDIDYLDLDPDSAQPYFDSDLRELSRNSSSGPQPGSDASCLNRVYHPKLNGKSSSYCVIPILI